MKRKTLLISSVVSAAISLLFFIPGVLHILAAVEYLGAMNTSGADYGAVERILYVTDGCCMYFAGGCIPLLGAVIFFLLSRIAGKRTRAKYDSH